MTMITQFLNLKKIIPVMVVFAVLVTVFNLSSFDSSNMGLSMLTPETAQAALVTGAVLDKGESTTADSKTTFVCNIRVNGSSGTTTVPFGGNASLSWQVEGYGPVTLNGEPVNATGTRTLTNIQTNSTYTIRAFYDDGTIYATCNQTVRIIVVPPPLPACVSFTAAPTLITSGATSTLTWTTQNAKSASISQGIGSVPVNGSQFVYPKVTTTYILLVAGSNNQTANCSVTIVVVPPPPPLPVCVSFTSSQAQITPGQSVTLDWLTLNAISASINQGIGAVPVNGSRVVSPTVTTNYTLTVLGANNQSDSCIVTVTVTPATLPPFCQSFTATPISGAPGSQRTLTWTTQNAVSASISNGVGSVAVNGSVVVSPTVTTTYALIVMGANNQIANCSVTVTVTPAPLAPICLSFIASPSSITSGATSTLTWMTQNAIAVAMNQGIGTVGLNGTYVVSPTVTTTYMLLVTGANNQTANCFVTVTILPQKIEVELQKNP